MTTGMLDDTRGARALTRALEETERLYALRFDERGRVLGCNGALGRLLGTSAPDLRGAPLETVLIPPDAAALKALLRDGRPHVARRVRLAFRAADASVVTVECAIALEGGGGALLAGPAAPGAELEER